MSLFKPASEISRDNWIRAQEVAKRLHAELMDGAERGTDCIILPIKGDRTTGYRVTVTRMSDGMTKSIRVE